VLVSVRLEDDALTLEIENHFHEWLVKGISEDHPWRPLLYKLIQNFDEKNGAEVELPET
jgi:hypothetical protein